MKDDIRDNPYIDHKDVLELNFIRDPGTYVFRRHYRQGMRSHIMEVLDPKDVENETKGIVIDGLKLFPRAQPLKMLRIFRTRFSSLKNAEEEVRRVKTIEAYLAPDNLARSNEFLVDYIRQGKLGLILCGLQEYVKGAVLEPWSHLSKDQLVSLLYDMVFEKVDDPIITNDKWIHIMRKKAVSFIGKLKQMIMETNHVPDLAGVGNLFVTRNGDIKLVDINNISRVSFDSGIHLDDKGYPVCDKSIEALSLLEQKLLGKSLHINDIIYKTFLDPIRMKEVQAIDKEFHRSMELEKSSS
jgi:hypothetical protein